MGRPEASQPDLFVFTHEAETQSTEGVTPRLLVVQGRVVTAPTPQPWSAVSLLRCGPQMGQGRDTGLSREETALRKLS